MVSGHAPNYTSMHRLRVGVWLLGNSLHCYELERNKILQLHTNNGIPSMLNFSKLSFVGRFPSHGSPQISSAISLTNASFFRWSSKLKGYPLS